ncbi:MAG TPA: CAP domain-containing protein [Patescibacteria group bacterium]|nr:CAP domain-containing protein [Patescibacteria group bacterium]
MNDSTFSPEKKHLPEPPTEPGKFLDNPGLTTKIWENVGRLTATALCIIAASGTLAAESRARLSSNPDCANPSADASREEQLSAMRCLIRYANLKRSITAGTSLTRSAQRKSYDVVGCSFSHYACEKTSTTYINPKFQRKGENLAWGVGESGTAHSIYNAWIHSKSHRKNIVDPLWDRFGVAVIKSGEKNIWTAHFGEFKIKDK